MKREQLNTGILLNILSAMNVNNILVVESLKLSRSDKTKLMETVNELIDKSHKLSDRSRELDNLENNQ